MFPSNQNGNNDIDPSPTSYADHSILYINPYSKHEDHPLSVFHFPSPYNISHYESGIEEELQEHNLFQLHQHHDLMADNSVSEPIINLADSSKNDEYSMMDCSFDKISLNNAADDHHQQIPTRQRSSKRDRHSKINTAKGPRDRRMRLSLEVAREFFGLQDMLGYDKASKTVQWLLIQAKAEIKKLAYQSQGLSRMKNPSCSFVAKSASSTNSECEVVSRIEETASKGSVCNDKGKVMKPSAKGKKTRQPRKTTFRSLSRDSRKKARARAKERTEAKLRCRKFDEETQTGNNHQLSSWSTSFETCCEECGTQSHNMNDNHNSLEAVAEVGEPSPTSHAHGCEQHLRIQENIMVDEPLALMSKWSPNSIFNCLHSAVVLQEHQLMMDFQSFGKPWDAYTNQNLC